MVTVSISALVLAIKSIAANIKARTKASRDGSVTEADEEDASEYILDLQKALSELTMTYQMACRDDPKLPPLETWLDTESRVIANASRIAVDFGRLYHFTPTNTLEFFWSKTDMPLLDAGKRSSRSSPNDMGVKIHRPRTPALLSRVNCRAARRAPRPPIASRWAPPSPTEGRGPSCLGGCVTSAAPRGPGGWRGRCAGAARRRCGARRGAPGRR
jgi:hypothetical protein